MRVGDEGGALPLLVRYSTLAYDEWCISPAADPSPPHLAVAFNAGLWGYDSWEPTVRRLYGAGVPVVVTAYHPKEAEEDAEMLEEWGVSRWQWRPELNPWRSLAREERQGELPHALWESCSTQCVGAWRCC